jgi:hypothetical protein
MIEEMNLPASLKTLDVWVFSRCKGLKKVTLSPKMTTIEEHTFYECSSLTSVEGMNVIQFIGDRAFSDYSSPETIDVNQSADFGDSDYYAFDECNAVINYIGSK